MNTTEPDPQPTNSGAKSGYPVRGRGILFETVLKDPWGGTLRFSLSVDGIVSTDEEILGAADAAAGRRALRPVSADASTDPSPD